MDWKEMLYKRGYTRTFIDDMRRILDRTGYAVIKKEEDRLFGNNIRDAIKIIKEIWYSEEKPKEERK